MAVEKVIEEVVSKHGPDKGDLETVTKQNNAMNAEAVDFDDLLSAAGKLDRYQLLLCLATIPFFAYGVFGYFSQIFLTEASPNHWCWIPELENLTDLQRKNLAIPVDERSRFGYSQCKAYDANWTEVLLTERKPDSTSWKTIPCQQGWEFNKSEIPYPTITSELGWVCERDSYQATAQSIFFAGCILGGFIFGWVADRFGRIPATVASCLTGCIGGIASIFATNFVGFVICRFVMGLAYDTCMMMAYLLLLEYIAPKYRSLVANISFSIFYSFFVTILPWIALACGHWKTTALVTSLPMAFAIFSPLILPESPRWLLSKGRVDDAVNKILKICQVNKRDPPTKLIEKFKETVAKTKPEESKSVIELLKRPILRKVFLLLCLQYCCSALIFDAIVRSIGTLNFDFFVSFSVVSVTEFPSMLLVAFVMDWMGRRWLSSISCVICFVFCLLTVVVGAGLPSVLCTVVARFMINMSYGVAMQWAAELLPTPVRGSGMAIVHNCGFIGTMISPMIVYTENIIYWLPLVVVSGVALCSAVIAFLMPETAKREMPQTFDDAENLFRHQRLWDMPFLAKNKTDKKGQVNDCFEP